MQTRVKLLDWVKNAKMSSQKEHTDLVWNEAPVSKIPNHTFKVSITLQKGVGSC